MKNLKYLFIFIVLILMSVSFLSCGNSDPRKDYKTAEPLSTYRYTNIFSLSYYETININFVAKKVYIYNDFSADIIYEISDKTLEKEGDESQNNSIKKDSIINAIDYFNKEKIYKHDNKYKLYEQKNRVLYLDENSIEEISFNEEDTIRTKIVLSVYVTNLNYVSTYYKLMSLEDYIKSEDEKNIPTLQKNYSNFFFVNSAGQLEKTSLKGMENPEKFKVLILEGTSSTSPSVETEFVFEDKIIAFNKTDSVNSGQNSITVKSSDKSSYIAIMYQADKNSVNWAILGPVIGVSALFLLVLSIKIIKLVKNRPNAKKGY